MGVQTSRTAYLEGAVVGEGINEQAAETTVSSEIPPMPRMIMPETFEEKLYRKVGEYSARLS